MLVLKEFKIDENAETFLSKKGRQEGIQSWLLAKIGLDPIVEMTCNQQEIAYKSSSARQGQQNINIPNTAVTAVVTGYSKPFQALVLAMAFIIVGLIFGFSEIGAIAAVFGGVAGLILIIYYLLNKRMFFGVYNGGDRPIAVLVVKRSVIEGVAIDFTKFEQAATLLNKAVLESSNSC